MKKGLIVTIAVLVIVIVGSAFYATGVWQRHAAPTPSSNTQTAAPLTGTPPPAAQGHTASGGPTRPSPEPNKTAAAAPKKAGGSTAAHYCAAGHDKSDTQALTQAGGLVQIFQHEAALADAYGCATAYLNHGGKVNAPDPRPNSEHLTPLLFAIKRNDPKMVHFMLDHGADPHQRAGPKHIRPYGYAVFEALHNQSTNYNAVINILDSALGDHPASSDGS